MADIKNTTRAQTVFLRSFRTHPAGPPAELWPSPAILRRWLRKPNFRHALDDLIQTLRYQSDFHLTAAACQAAQHLACTPHSEISNPEISNPQSLSLLRLSHLRQRFEDRSKEPSIDS